VLKATFFASPFAPSCYPGFYLTKGEIKGSKANKQKGEIEGFASICACLFR
jgi:hypothetical protein